MVGGFSIVFTRKDDCDETLNHRFSKTCKKVVVSFEPVVLTCTPGLSPCLLGFLLDNAFTATCQENQPQSKQNFLRWNFSFSRLITQKCMFESFSPTALLKEFDCFFSADGFCSNCNIVFEAVSCFHFCSSCQEAQLSSKEVFFERSFETRQVGRMWKQYIEENGENSAEISDIDLWLFYKTDVSVMQYFSYFFQT